MQFAYKVFQNPVATFATDFLIYILSINSEICQGVLRLLCFILGI